MKKTLLIFMALIMSAGVAFAQTVIAPSNNVPGVYVLNQAIGDSYTGANIMLGSDAGQWPWSTADGGALAFTPVAGATYHMTFNVTSTGTSGFRVRWIKDNTNGGYTTGDADVVNNHKFTADQTGNFVPAYYESTIANGETKTYSLDFTMDGSQLANQLVGNLAIRGQSGSNDFVINKLMIKDAADNMLVNYDRDPTEAPQSIILDFEADAIGTTYSSVAWRATDITAVVEAAPAGGSGKVLHVTGVDYNAFPKFTVALPTGKTLANIEKIKFDIYFNDAAGETSEYPQYKYKAIEYFIGAKDAAFTANQPTGKIDNLIAGETAGTWIQKEFSITIAGDLLTLNEFDLAFGMSHGKLDYYLDNIEFVAKTDAVNNVQTAPAFGYHNGIISVFNGKQAYITVFNILGKQVLSAATVSTMSLSNLPSGIYIVKVNVDGKNSTAKIVK